MIRNSLSIAVCAVLFLFSFSLIGQSKAQKISIKATNSFAYCGGVDPGDDEIKRLATPVAMKNTMLFVRRGTYNDVNSKIIGAGKTDTSGNVVFSLDTGTYVVVGKAKLDKKLHDEYLKRYKYKTELNGPVNKECLDKWLKQPLTVIHVKENGPATFTFNILVPCNFEGPPCVNFYNMSYPP
ncbi:MAG: hypothetical protein K0S32_3970 [Bacteroidetes bacterium]|jgi:hypothetical protein|nr:hypothetical protein [Bacteroidota bacterium]